MASRGPIANLARLFSAACRARGAADFLVDDRERFSGESAEAASLAAVAALRAAGASPGSRVGFLSRSSARHALLWFAVQRLSAVPVNLHVLETDRRLAELVAWLDLDLIVVDPEFLSRAPAIAGAVAVLDLAAIDLAAPSQPALAEDGAASDAPAAIMLSSGSTGAPKAVLHTQRSLTTSALAVSHVYGRVSQRDATAVFMGTSFAAWVHVVLPFVAGRAKLAFRGRFTPDDFLAVLEEEAVTIAPAVPTMWRMVLGAGVRRDRLALRTVMFSGEPSSAAEIAAIRAGLCDRILAAYLSTEGACAAGIVADERDLAATGRADGAGYPVPGAEVRIIDPAGSIDDLLPDDTVGEVAVRSASVAAGYWKDPDRTAAHFVDGWWRSGDLGLREADGFVRLKGRSDNLINSGGLKVHAEEVELVLVGLPEVAQVAVVGIRDGKWGERIEAFVVARDMAVTEALIIERCRAGGLLAAAKIPKRIHIVESLPRSPTGKLFRPALRALAEAGDA